jgi:hypothetical protein
MSPTSADENETLSLQICRESEKCGSHKAGRQKSMARVSDTFDDGTPEKPSRSPRMDASSQFYFMSASSAGRAFYDGPNATQLASTQPVLFHYTHRKYNERDAES